MTHRDELGKSIRVALESAARKMLPERARVDVEFDSKSFRFSGFQIRTVVRNVQDDVLEMTLEDAQKLVPIAALGDDVHVPVDVPGFSRVTELTKNHVIAVSNAYDHAYVDHLVIAARDLDEGVSYVASKLGVRAAPGGSHPAWGTRNALLAIGPEQYLEVIAPDPELTAPENGYPFGIEQLDRPKLVTWAAKAYGIDDVVARARELGYDPGPVFDGERRLPDGTALRWRLTMPQLEYGDGIVPFLIDWGSSPHPAGGLPSAGRISGFEAGYPDPGSISLSLAAMGIKRTRLAGFRVGPGERSELCATIETESGPVQLL
jgi:hypothetical protein